MAVSILMFTGCDEMDGGGKGGMGAGVDKLKRRGAMKGKNHGRRWLRKKVKGWVRTSASDKLEDLQIKDEYEVVGFEPSFTLLDGNKPFESHYYNLLTTLVIGSYDLNPKTGQARSIEHRDAPLSSGAAVLAREKNENVVILYSVSHHGDFGKDLLKQRQNFESFLTKVETQGSMLESVNDMVDTIQADGIFIDFRNIPANSIGKFVEFLKLAREKGTEYLGDQYIIYARLPTNEREQYFSEETIKQLDEVVDMFVIKGYENGGTSKPGPLAPIRSNTLISMDSLVDYYTSNGLTRKQLVMEFPLYGTVWNKKPGEDDTWSKNGQEALPYRDIYRQARAATTYPKDSSYAYFADIDKNKYIFYEDKKTLHGKYVWVDSMELGGIGLWALGYNKYKDKKLWISVADIFAIPQVVLVPSILTYLLLFIMSSFAYSIIRYWQVRNFLNRKRSYLIYYAVGIIVVSLLIFVAAYLLPRGMLKGMRIAALMIVVFMLFPMARKYFINVRRWV